MRLRSKPLLGGLLAAAALVGLAGSIPIVDATVSSGTRAIYVPITPCRLFDTRPAELNVGPRATPIGAGETIAMQVRGTNGNCTIPVGAVGVAMNTTAVNGTVASFLTVFPTDVARPLASSLNWVAGQGAAPNQLNVTLAADGRISLYNNAGSVDVIGDIVGYYEDHNHDDRTTTRSISFPAESMNIPTPSSGVTRGDGIVWGYTLSGAASLFIHRPADFVASSTVTVKLFFLTLGAVPADTKVQFFARPRNFASGDPWSDLSGIDSDIVTVDTDSLFQVTIVIPPGSLPLDWWEIYFQRNAPITGGFTGFVQVKSVEISYTGYVVAPVS